MSTRRARLASTSTSSTPTPATVPTRIPTLARPASADLPQLQELRRQWKWAAFSQFFYTFAPVFAMEDVSLTVRSPIHIVCPRSHFLPPRVLGYRRGFNQLYHDLHT